NSVLSLERGDCRLELNDRSGVNREIHAPFREGPGVKLPRSTRPHAVVMEPLDFIGRLCALIPPPKFHMLRFHGVLAPHSSLRARVVFPAQPQAPSSQPAQLLLFGE